MLGRNTRRAGPDWRDDQEQKQEPWGLNYSSAGELVLKWGSQKQMPALVARVRGLGSTARGCQDPGSEEPPTGGMGSLKLQFSYANLWGGQKSPEKAELSGRG